MFDPEWFGEVPAYEPGAPFSDDAARMIEHGYDVLERRGQSALFPGFAWTVLAAQESAELVRLESRLPFVERLTFGFFEPEIDGRTGFGLVACASPPTHLLEGGLDDLYSAVGVEFVAAGRSFPVRVRIVNDYLEASITSPAAAQAAVWTAVQKSSRRREGWLLPYHAVRSPSAAVTYSDGCQGRVIDSFGHCWDAVLASSNTTRPPGTSVAAVDVLAPGLQLQLTDQHGKNHAPRLVQVEVNIGLLSYSKAPLRMTYDWDTSSPGDSGVLVSDTSVPALPVAMHQGTSVMRDLRGTAIKAADGSAVRRAFGLCLFQIQATKDGEFFV